MNEDFIGRWAINGAGILGKITGGRTDERGVWVYIGEGITGEGWGSRTPILLQVEQGKQLDYVISGGQ